MFERNLIASLLALLSGCSAGPLLPAERICPAAAIAACEAPEVGSGLWAAYRKDFFYPYETYPEASLPDPLAGGRVQLVSVARASGALTGVTLDGQNTQALLDSGELTWLHVWPQPLVAGEPLWLAFHGRSPLLDAGGELEVRVEAGEGTALEGRFTPAVAPVQLTYRVQSADGTTAYLFLRNGDTAAHTLRRLLVDGRVVTEAACVPSPTLEPGAAALWSVPLCQAPAPGAAWTAVAEFEPGTAPAVGTGRVISRLHFPIHTWPSSDDCPFPGGDAAAFQEHLDHGFDTFFVHGGTYASCGRTGEDLVNEYFPGSGVFALPERDIQLTDDSAVLARFTGDEADDEVFPNARVQAEASEAFWRAEPQLPTYLGGSRHRHNGAFAGVSDLQGMDIYAAACAPHVTDWGPLPPLRAPYDYAAAVRQNHMPGACWIYAQGLHPGWNYTLLEPAVDRQPSPAEARIQALGVIAAGAKGLMWFQSTLAEARANPATWEEIGRVNREVRGVRDLLLWGDPTGGARTDGVDVIVEAIRAPDALVVPVIDARGEDAPGDTACLAGEDPHWRVVPQTVTLRVLVPADLRLAEVFEVAGSALRSVSPGPRLEGRTLVLPEVELTAEQPSRLFVLAAGPWVRARVSAALEAP